ncbi:MAG: type I-C CRISPR-associated protein Cas8c/Csd1 [Phycisphaeraceae bacterium]|nr:type I-C CRISPR-associated protein Cas8c/Csd1 [Phycisphaeraceae bacterium]
MIVPALVRLYDRMAAEGDDDIAPMGYSRQQISFKVVLNKDGSLHAFDPVFQEQKREIKKRVKGQVVIETKTEQRPEMLIVPGQSKPSGIGINPCFLWDRADYMLGFKPDDPKPERTRQAFEAFRKRHLDAQKQIDDPAFDTVCKFLKSWNPDDATSHPHLVEIATNFGVFQIRAEAGYVHKRPKVASWWQKRGHSWHPAKADKDALVSSMPTLVDGRSLPIARIHEPGIRGVGKDAAKIVSFDDDAFRSYRKEKGANAPVGVDDAFKYCTALNRLTEDENRRVRIAGDTYVFWSEGAPKAESFLAWSLDDAAKWTDEHAADAYRRAVRGLDVVALGDPKTPFYILGLSPNMSRLSVRIWLASTVGEVAAHLRQHHAELAMEPAPDDAPPLTIRRIVNETAAPKGGFPDQERVSPLLSASVVRAVLSGGVYPRVLLGGVLARARIEGLADSQTRNDWRHAQHRRCAIIRMCLLREARLNNRELEVPVSLDVSRDAPGYLVGRLFAVLERIQEDALGRNLNTTIKDRYYGAASSTPAAVFPRLLRMTQHHANKIDIPGKKVNRDKELGGIMDRLVEFPRSLSLEDQGLFAIGYYHQRQSYFADPSSKT